MTTFVLRFCAWRTAEFPELNNDESGQIVVESASFSKYVFLCIAGYSAMQQEN